MALSNKQLEANRRNALRSTGPKTPKGKRAVKRNALKHGLLSREVLIKGEDGRALEELGKNLRHELVPQDELENILVERIISSVWRLRRAVRVERDYLQEEYQDCKNYDWNGKESGDSKAWNLVVARALGNSTTWLNLVRYETSIEKQMYKALHELMRLQSARRGEKPALPLAVDVSVSDKS